MVCNVTAPYLNPNVCHQAEAWKMAYDIIKLENNLINHRMTALLVTNGFLLAALGSCDNFPFAEDVHYVVFLLAGSACIITLTLARGIAAASRQIFKSAQWYSMYCRENITGSPESVSPQIVGYPTSWSFLGIEFGKKPLHENGKIISDNDKCSLSTGINWLVAALLIFWMLIVVINFLAMIR